MKAVAAVDSSTNSSPQLSEPVSPAVQAQDYRTDDPQPPTLGQECMEGEWASDYTGCEAQPELGLV